MSYTAAAEICRETEFKKLAACFLNSQDAMKNVRSLPTSSCSDWHKLTKHMQVDWDKAARQFDPSGKTQVASFKTYMGRLLKKIKEAETAGGHDGAAATNGDGEADGGKGKKAKASGGKRKKAAAEDGEGEGEQPKAKRGRKLNVKSEEPEAEAGVDGDVF